MACPDADELQGFIARQLDATAGERVAAHVEGCDSCRALILALTRAQREAQSMTETALDDGEPRAAGAAGGLTAGAKIGRYVVSQPLGVGGMGMVYAAWDPQLERKVALKLLRPDSSVAPDMLQARLVREAQAMARLSHPNVVTVYEVGTHGEQVFVAMEYVEGGTLRDWLRAPPRSWREIVRAFCAAGEGLSAAHSAGLVHRDFKPDNVLVRRDGRFGVTDFGLARETANVGGVAPDDEELRGRFEDRLTRTGALVGTPAYMAPEQLTSNRCDERSDLFSFCVALYEALYDVRPFSGKNLAELRASIARQAPEPRGSSVPPWLTRTVLRGLRADPAERPQSMRELIDALQDDPRQKLIRRGGIALLGVMTLAVVGLLGDRWSARRHRCDAAGAPIADHWNEARKSGLERAFAATRLPYAGDTARFVGRVLDGWAASWRDERVSACRAGEKGVQSAELYDLRMQCLDDRLSELDATLAELSRADVHTVNNSQELVAALGGVTGCRDERRVRAIEPPPAQAKKLQPTRDGLARAMAALQNDRLAQARVELAPFTTEVPWPPLEAQRQMALGMVAIDSGELQRAEDAFYAAVVAGERGHDDDEATMAWMELADVVGRMFGRHQEALRILRISRAKNERMGPHNYMHMQDGYEAQTLAMLGRYREALPLVEEEIAIERRNQMSEVSIAKALTLYGNILGMSGRAADGEKAHREALAIMERDFGGEHPMICPTLVNVGVDAIVVGHPAEALPPLDRALAIRKRIFRPDHPLIASVLTNRAGAYDALGRWPEALADAEPAVQMLAKALSPDHPALVEPLNDAARAQLGLGKPRLALPLAERALAIADKGQADAADAAGARFLVARALVESGGDRRRAATLAEAARSGFAKLARELGGQYVARLAELDGWRAQHPL